MVTSSQPVQPCLPVLTAETNAYFVSLNSAEGNATKAVTQRSWTNAEKFLYYQSSAPEKRVWGVSGFVRRVGLVMAQACVRVAESSEEAP